MMTCGNLLARVTIQIVPSALTAQMCCVKLLLNKCAWEVDSGQYNQGISVAVRQVEYALITV